jgi:hypothetical protein
MQLVHEPYQAGTSLQAPYLAAFMPKVAERPEGNGGDLEGFTPPGQVILRQKLYIERARP